MRKCRSKLVVLLFGLFFLLTSCGIVKKIDNKEKTNGSNSEIETGTEIEKMNFDTKEIAGIRDDVADILNKLGTDSSIYGNLADTSIIPIITDKDEIYSLQLEKMDGNNLSKTGGVGGILSTKSISSQKKIYRNDMEGRNIILKYMKEKSVGEIMNYVEEYLDSTYEDSPFKWCVEYMQIYTTSDKQNYISLGVRPSYEGIVFTRTLVLNNGIPTNIPEDFRCGLVNMTETDKIDEYYDISPYYNVKKQGEPIKKILSIDSVLSIVANKIDTKSVSEIRIFELAYRLNRDLTAVPIWNIVVYENGNERNFQIDAVTGDVYFE